MRKLVAALWAGRLGGRTENDHRESRDSQDLSLPDVSESWNLVCDKHPESHYCHAGFPVDPEAHRGAPCMTEGCDGRLRPRTKEDRLAWTVAA